ncbi:transglycosylase SLT domain-containing protein [Cupriavidus oxalaticus]|uniref:transglycosylase SLT domain-containing protein n=1 Tax=Cupriavidus oxalaticus TaxID=96344 RepID=UPI003180D6EB
MLDSLMQDSIDQTLDDRQQRPVAEPRQQSGFSVWNTIKAPVVGAAAGGVEAGGFGADVLGAFGQVQAGYGAMADPSLLLSPDEMQKRRDAGEQARQQVASGEAFSTELGTGLRTTAREMMPDPATSNVVEQTLFQLGRFGGKAVGYAAAAGPFAGAAILAGDEGMAEADRLKAQGVDIGTRTQVGAIAGAAAGLGVALPVAGTTIARTAALVVAGGPGAYIAQQAASKAILENADYSKVAEQYDPFDPVGLAVSTLVPAGFGAWAARGMRGAKPAPAGDAAAARALVDMGGNERKALAYNDPRLDAYAVTAAQREGIPPEALLAIKNAGERSKSSAATSPVGAKGIMQFMDKTWAAYGKGDVRDPVANIDGAARYMKALIQQYGGDVRAAIAHYNGGGKNAEAVLKTGRPISDETIKYLQRTDAYMAQHAGETAGRASANDPDAQAAARTQLIRDTVDSWNLKDPTDITAAQDHLAAIVKASDQLGAGNRVDVSDTIHWGTLQQTRMLDDMVSRLESARADLLPEVGQAAEPGAIRNLRTEVDQLRRSLPDTSDEAIRARAKELQAEGEGRVSYKQAQSAARKEITALAHEHAVRIDRLEQQMEANRGAEQARQALQQVDQQIAGIRSQRAALDAPPSPVKATALAAGEAARTGKQGGPSAAAAEPSAAKPASESPASGTKPAADATTAPNSASDAAMASVDAQAAAIAKLSPDMMVQLEGMDAPVRLADALEAVKAEAARDAADAPLLEVAAQCFLRSA